MYSFQTGAGRRKAQKTVRILSVVVFVLAIALIGVTVSYLHASGVSRSTSDALMARATNEANEAQTAVYRLTQSSGTNTMTLLSNVRSHIYALQCLNTLAANIYGAGPVIVDGSMPTACIARQSAPPPAKADAPRAPESPRFPPEPAPSPAPCSAALASSSPRYPDKSSPFPFLSPPLPPAHTVEYMRGGTAHE